MSGNTSWMDAFPTAAPTSAMQMMAAMKMGAGSGAQPVPNPAPSASPLPTPPAADPVPQQMATLTVRPKPGQVVGAPASNPDTSWMDALPTAQPTSAMLLMAAPKGPPADPGVFANIGAGTSEATANTLGAPVDLATGALNLIPRGINAVAGTSIPTIQNPVGGSTWLKSQFGRINADPRTVAAPSELDRIARAGGAGAASMLLPWGAANAVAPMTGLAGAAQEMAGAGTAPTMATAGFTGGAAGQEAQDSAPAPLKPLANMLGNVVGGGVPLAARAAVDAALPAVGGAAAHYLQPLREGNATGPIGRGLDKLAAGGVQQAAGQRIASAATDLGAVRGALQDAPTAIVPGSEPTTFQLTGDQGLGNLERAAAKENPDQFIRRAAEQNQARVGQITAQAPATASPQDVATSFQQQLAALDAQHAGGAAADQQAVRSAVAPLGGEPPVGPGAQATALQQYGGALRGTLTGAAGGAKAQERALWSQVDPDGSMRVGMAPIREAATAIAKAMPANAAPMAGEEAAIFGKARMLPAVQPFAELGALRSRITDAMRAELAQNGSSQSYRRMTQLLGAVGGAMSDGVQAQAERDAAGVADGTRAPDDTVQARVREANVATTGASPDEPVAPTGTLGDGHGRIRPLPGAKSRSGEEGGTAAAAGTRIPESRLQGDGALVRALPPGTTAQVTKPQSLADFLIAHGGVQDQDGDLRAMDAQTVHHRQGGRLLNAKGVSLDYAREAAVQAGFPLPENSIQGLKDALHHEMAGRPVYRPEDEPLAAEWRSGRTEADRQVAALASARFDAHGAADDLGVRLAPGEADHAAQMIAGGMDHHDAVTEAVRTSTEAALQRNAELNAVGRPGMPLAEQMALPGGEGGEVPNFDAEAQARYQAAREATARYHQTYTDQRTAPGVAPALAPGSRADEFRAPESAVPGLLFAPGRGAAERVGAFLKAGGTAAQVKDYLAFSLRSAAEKEDGTLKAPVLERWLGQNREALDAAGIAPEFDTVAKAQSALDVATARRAAERTAFQKSAAGQFLGEGDPVAIVGRILRSNTAEATMRDLARRSAGDPVARAGLQKAVVEHILGDLRSNAEAGDTGVRQLKADAFQTFVRKASPALRQIFKPDQVKAIEDVAADIQRTQRSVIGTKLPGGSNTAQDLAAGVKHGGGHPSMVGVLMWSEAAGEAAQHAGGPLGKALGMVAVPMLNAMRQQGIRRVDDLVTEAMLHPELARALLAKVPGGGFTKSVVDNAVRQIRALGANAALRGPMQIENRKDMKR